MVGARWEFSIKGLHAANKNARRRLPLSPELLEFSRRNLGIDKTGNERKFDRAWAAKLIGFMFLLRAIELAAITVKEVTFGERAGARYIRIFIRKSKTDQEEFGAFRSLGGTGNPLRPYRRMEMRMAREQFENRDDPVFRDGILGLVTRLIKSAVSEHNLPSDKFSIHSLRPGGATRLYHSGADIEYVRRFG